MGTGPDRDIVADDGPGVDVGLVFDDDSPHTGDVRVDAVPVADAGVVTDHGIGLDHVVISHHRIVADDGEGPDEVAFSQLGVLVDARRLMDQLHELAAAADDLLHAGPPGGAADGRHEHVVRLRLVVPDRPDDGRITIITIQCRQVIVNTAFHDKGFTVPHTLQRVAINRPAHPAGTNDNQIFHCLFFSISSSNIRSNCLAITSPENRERIYPRITSGE